MEIARVIVAVLVLWNCASGQKVSDREVVTIRDGSTVTLNCSGKSDKTILYISWAVIINGSREVLATSHDNLDENSPECNEEHGLKGVSDCMIFTTFSSNSFTSELIFQNVTLTSREAVIECIMVDEENENSDAIWIMQSYELDVYHLSEDLKCNALVDVNDSIKVFCEASEVYPDIYCRIMPHIQRNFPNQVSKSELTKLPELVNITRGKRRLNKNVGFYEASWSFKYYPTEPGRYLFHAEMYSSKDRTKPVATFTTNSVEINASGVYFKQSIQKNNSSLSETNTAFYMLIGSVLILALSVFLIISWIIWVKRGSCQSSTTATIEGNEYESIIYNPPDPMMCKTPVGSSDEGYGESTGGDVFVSDSEADGETHQLKLLDDRGYIPNVPVHMGLTPGIEYIDPVTPTSTLSRSVED